MAVAPRKASVKTSIKGLSLTAELLQEGPRGDAIIIYQERERDPEREVVSTLS